MPLLVGTKERSFMTESPSPRNKSLAIVAGNGEFPTMVAEGARRQGYSPIIILAQRGHASQSLQAKADGCFWVHVGQIGKMLAILKREKISNLVLAGGINRKQLKLKLDFGGIRFFWGLRNKGDDALLKHLAQFFEARNVTVLDGSKFMQNSLAPTGCIAGRLPSEREQKDIALGFKVAKALGSVDVGQSVTVHNGMVVGVEALEGTDALILRSGEITGLADKHPQSNGLILVKVAKPQQDLRLDRPTIGVETIFALSHAGGTVLAIEAGVTMILNPAEVLSACEKTGVSIVGV